jgi:hypothetical protein
MRSQSSSFFQNPRRAGRQSLGHLEDTPGGRPTSDQTALPTSRARGAVTVGKLVRIHAEPVVGELAPRSAPSSPQVLDSAEARCDRRLSERRRWLGKARSRAGIQAVLPPAHRTWRWRCVTWWTRSPFRQNSTPDLGRGPASAVRRSLREATREVDLRVVTRCCMRVSGRHSGMRRNGRPPSAGYA